MKLSEVVAFVVGLPVLILGGLAALAAFAGVLILLGCIVVGIVVVIASFI